MILKITFHRSFGWTSSIRLSKFQSVVAGCYKHQFFTFVQILLLRKRQYVRIIMKNLENPFITPPTKVSVNSFLMDEGFLEKRSIIVFAAKSWVAEIVKTVFVSTNIGFHTKKRLKRQAWDLQIIAQFPAFFLKRKFFNRHYFDVFPSMGILLG